MKTLVLAIALLLTSQSTLAGTTLYKVPELDEPQEGIRMQISGRVSIVFFPESIARTGTVSAKNKDFPYRVAVPVLVEGGKTDTVALRAASLKDALALKEVIDSTNKDTKIYFTNSGGDIEYKLSF